MVRLGSLITQLFRFSFFLFNCNSKINNALRKRGKNLKKAKAQLLKVEIYQDICMSTYFEWVVLDYFGNILKYFWNTVLEWIVCRNLNVQKIKYELKN